jgi:hypothetical protein
MFKKSIISIFVIAWVLGLTASFTGDARAQTIIYEESFTNGAGITSYPDWEIGSNDPGNAGTIDQVIGNGKVADVVDDGTGNFAILIGTNNVAGSQIRMQNITPFPREDRVMVEFKIWGDPNQNWACCPFPTGRGIAGPWHSDPSQPNNKPSPNKKINDTVEAGVNWWLGLFGNARWEENGLRDTPDLDPEGNLPGGHGTTSGPVADQAYQDALHNSGPTKANAVTIRVYLGDLPPFGTGGGFMEWSTDGVNFTGLTTKEGGPFGAGGVMQTGGILLDSRAPGYDPPRNDFDNDGDGMGHPQVPGLASPCYIAFGAGVGNITGSHFYDDFVVTTQGPPPNASQDWMIYN